MEELPLNLRIKYFRHTQQNLPEGKEGIRIYLEAFEGRSVCTRVILIEKVVTKRQIRELLMDMFGNGNDEPDDDFMNALQID